LSHCCIKVLVCVFLFDDRIKVISVLRRFNFRGVEIFNFDARLLFP
jgi:hypothetical protein